MFSLHIQFDKRYLTVKYYRYHTYATKLLYYIKEKAYFIPPNPTKKFFPFPGPMMAMTEDVVVDDRGNIIIDANSDGFYILRKTYED